MQTSRFRVLHHGATRYIGVPPRYRFTPASTLPPLFVWASALHHCAATVTRVLRTHVLRVRMSRGSATLGYVVRVITCNTEDKSLSEGSQPHSLLHRSEGVLPTHATS